MFSKEALNWKRLSSSVLFWSFWPIEQNCSIWCRYCLKRRRRKAWQCPALLWCCLGNWSPFLVSWNIYVTAMRRIILCKCSKNQTRGQYLHEWTAARPARKVRRALHHPAHPWERERNGETERERDYFAFSVPPSPLLFPLVAVRELCGVPLSLSMAPRSPTSRPIHF